MIDRQYSSHCFLASELSIEKKIKYSRQAAYSQSMGFAINISHAQYRPQTVTCENRNILLWSVNHANNKLCIWQNAFSRHRMDSSLWLKRMELVEVKSLIWAQKGKLYIIYENVMWILGILIFKSIHLLFYIFIYMLVVRWWAWAV
jgi:hypothetical protein